MGWDKSLGLTGAQSGHKCELQDAGDAPFLEGAGLGHPIPVRFCGAPESTGLGRLAGLLVGKQESRCGL